MLRTTTRSVAAVLALIVSLGTLSTFVATTASANPVASKRAEAARIAAQLEKLATRASMLTEDYNEARVKATELESRVRNSAAELAGTTVKAQQAASTLKAISLDAYMRGGLQRVGRAAGSDPARAQYYLQAAANTQNEAIDALHAAKETLAERQHSLAAARDQARKNLTAVSAKRKAAESAQAAQQALLAKVNGDLARLVAAERTRRTAPPAAAPKAARNRATPPAPTGVDAPAPNSGAAAAVAEAKRQLGKPYKWGGSGPDSFDCSGLTSWAWRVGAGRSLPHSSRAQYAATSRVSREDIQPGDLTFYGSSVGSIHHVGIYAGGGYMVDAPETGRNVQYVYAFRKDLVGIGRVN